MKRYLILAAIMAAALSGTALANDKSPPASGRSKAVPLVSAVDHGQGQFTTVSLRGRVMSRAYGYGYGYPYRPYFSGYGYGPYYYTRPYYGYSYYAPGWYGGWGYGGWGYGGGGYGGGGYGGWGYPGIGFGIGPMALGARGGFYW